MTERVDVERLLHLAKIAQYGIVWNKATNRGEVADRQEMVDGIRALAAENERLKGLLHRVWWIDYQRDDCGGDGPEEKHTCFVGLCETHRKEIEVALGVEGNELPKV